MEQARLGRPCDRDPPTPAGRRAVAELSRGRRDAAIAESRRISRGAGRAPIGGIRVRVGPAGRQAPAPRRTDLSGTGRGGRALPAAP